MSDNEGLVNRPACASCKHQRKKCPEGCVMAPHFPPSRTEDFQAVHKMFGIANVTRTIKSLDFAQQKEAIQSFIWEANEWVQDGVHGPYGQVRRLEDRIKSLEEERKRQEIVIRNMSERLSTQWDSRGVTNFRQDNAVLMPESSARNVNSSNFFGRVLEEKEESGLMGRVNNNNQGRGFDGIINGPNDFDYQNTCSSSSGFGQGRGRGYDGVWGSSVGQNSNFSSGGLARGGERFRVCEDHGMQDAASGSSSFVVDYSQQHVMTTNINYHINNLPDQADHQGSMEIRGGLNPKENSC